MVEFLWFLFAVGLIGAVVAPWLLRRRPAAFA